MMQLTLLLIDVLHHMLSVTMNILNVCIIANIALDYGRVRVEHDEKKYRHAQSCRDRHK